jgi:hypothetical protein
LGELFYDHGGSIDVIKLETY